MSIALKNDPEQVPRLVGDFDFAVVEECFEYDECDKFSPFVQAGKAVFSAEYEGSPAELLPRGRSGSASARSARATTSSPSPGAPAP